MNFRGGTKPWRYADKAPLIHRARVNASHLERGALVEQRNLNKRNVNFGEICRHLLRGCDRISAVFSELKRTKAGSGPRKTHHDKRSHRRSSNEKCMPEAGNITGFNTFSDWPLQRHYFLEHHEARPGVHRKVARRPIKGRQPRRVYTTPNLLLL